MTDGTSNMQDWPILQRGRDIDFMAPWFQRAPESQAILALLRRLTDRFQELPEETTEMDWTAFRALAKAGAAEGIIRSTCTYADTGGPCTEYFLVQGDYPSAMTSRPILAAEPFDSVLVQARLTTTGVRWAEHLAAENTQSVRKVRGFVLQLIWDAGKVKGSAQLVPPPDRADSLDEDPDTKQGKVATDGSGNKCDALDDDAMELGRPEIDLYDRRVVNWFGKRLYLGPEGSQIRELFMLLARKPGVPHSLGEVQRAVAGMETYRDEHGEDAFRKSMSRIAKALSKLRRHLRENDLDNHVVILKEGPRDEPSYTLVLRFGNS